MTVTVKFRQLAYTPANSVLSIILTAGTYELTELMTVAHCPEYIGDAEQKLAQVLGEDREILAWYRDAVLAMLAEASQQAADGCAPPINADTFELVARFVCGLKLLPYRGEVAPPVVPRWTPTKDGQCLDIVPSDPRWGWDDIPDWSEPG